MYRDDYLRGGLPMISGLDDSGIRTAQHIVMCTLNLTFVSLLPCVLQPMGEPLAGPGYFILALLLGGTFLSLGLRFYANRTIARARAVMLGSLVYLPALLTFWLVDVF